MPRLRKQLRLVLYQWFEEMGVYTDALPSGPSSVDLLADRILGIPAFSAVNVAERHKDAPTMGRKSIEMARKRLMLGEKIEALLDVTPDHKNKKWVRVLNLIVEAEERGDSFEKYVDWYNAQDKYHQPAPFKITENPYYIWGNWRAAQKFDKPESQGKML